MPSAAEEAFHKCLQESGDGVTRENVFVRQYRGRQDLAEVTHADLRVFLSAIKTKMNSDLAERKRVPEHFDDLPFHFDYIESDFSIALAFRNDFYAFIGITVPLNQGNGANL
jgi:hypothetical protein